MTEDRKTQTPGTENVGLNGESENDKTKRIDISQTSSDAAKRVLDAENANGETKRIDISQAEPADGDAEPADGDAEPAKENTYSAAEGTDARLLSEFAPKPIKIPNVDLEKEKKKQDKRRQNRDKEAKKVEVRKNKTKKKKKRSAGQKALVGIAGFLLFVLLSVSTAGFVGVLSLQAVTSNYAFRLSVKSMDVPEIAIGGIENYDELGLVKSSSNAALVDIIRDNSDVVVTYNEINSSLRSSTLESFISERLKNASDYLLKGESYDELTGSDVADVIKENSTLVRNLTGRVLSEEDYTAIADYFDNTVGMEAVSRSAIDASPISGYKDTVRHIMSLRTLAALLLITVVLIILMCIVCRESAYLPLGWSFIVGGIAVILGAIFFRPSYSQGALFLQSVLNGYFSFFTAAIIIIAGVVAVIGALIFLIGNASGDRDD